MIEPGLGDGASGAPTGDRLEPGFELLVDVLRDRRPQQDCFIIGVTGAVASGKSTLSTALRSALSGWPERPVVELVCTDGFLHSNQVLGALGLTSRKGFPESYDTAALRQALTAVRRGRAAFPGYSHDTYDVEPALERWIDRPDILIIEGLSLNPGRGEVDSDGADAQLVDCLIYLDAEEADIEHWFVGRFLGLWAAAEHDPGSFYARFRGLDRDQTAALARNVWTQVNLPNLRENIIGARDVADIVVRKRPDHGIEAIQLRGPD